MRSGKRRGVAVAVGLAFALGMAIVATARADGFHTIPRLVPAVDASGNPYYAPPVPSGHYTGTDITGHFGRRIGGLLHGGGNACGACGGLGRGCGLCGGSGLGHAFGHGSGERCGGSTCGLLHGGMFDKGCVACASPQVAPAPQAVVPVASAQCADPGCGLFGHHKHRGGAATDPCGNCGGKGCGLCGRLGGLGGLCGLCGGAGCAHCSKVKGLVNHLLGRDKIKWFTGPGGPVPLTPGYTPYVVTTRSPRDFFAFPPMTP